MGMAQCDTKRQHPGGGWERCGLAPAHHGECKFPLTPPSAKYDPPPTHYDGKGIDPWAVWDAFDLDRYTANAVKYLLRAGKKDIAPRLDDLKKARNYINKAIEREEIAIKDAERDPFG